MKATEASELVALMALYDNRRASDPDVVAWLKVIGDLDYTDCETAVLAHYRESRERIMPAHVRSRVRAMRRDRLARQITPAPPAELTDEPGRYKQAIEASVRRIANELSVQKAIAAPVRESTPPAEWTEARNALGAALEGPAMPLSPQEIARRQAAESRAARGAAEPKPENGESAA